MHMHYTYMDESPGCLVSLSRQDCIINLLYIIIYIQCTLSNTELYIYIVNQVYTTWEGLQIMTFISWGNMHWLTTLKNYKGNYF